MALASLRTRGRLGAHKMLWKLAAWAIISLGAAGQQIPLDERIKANEDIVRTVHGRATDLYRDRGEVVPGCECSVHACANTFPFPRECSDLLGHSEEICGHCETKGKMLGLQKSMVRTPPGEKDPENLSPEVIESICTFQPLEEDFVKKGPEGSYTWTYIGTTTGVHRIWPGLALPRDLSEADPPKPLESCKKFDPRERPWFNAASSGPKDVVIVLDTSESMGKALGSTGKTRWEVTRDAVSRLLGTFGISDFVSIVTFNSESEVLGGGATLIRATNANIDMLQSQIMDVTVEKGTDFRQGFQKAFDVLIESNKIKLTRDDGPSSSCTKVILFLTDGEDCSLLEDQKCADSEETEEDVDPNVVADFIRRKQSDLVDLGGESAHIFTFSMTSKADDKLARMISCENKGSWASIEEQDDPLLKFLDYIRFLAWTRRRLDVIWSNFYEDFSGLGMMTTAVMPVYAPNTSAGVPGLLVGAVGKDVLVSELQGDDVNFQKVFDRLIERSSTCRMVDENACQLQVLRGEKSECPDIFEDRPCFFLNNEKKYYTIEKQNSLSFEKAADECIKFGGQLAEPKSKDSHAFLSGLTTREGCWIGLRLRDVAPFHWIWDSSGEEAPPIPVADPTKSSFWAPPALGTHHCAAMDRRGRARNVFDAPCTNKMAFICEFEATNLPEQCSSSETLRVTEETTSMVPAITQCGEYERAKEASTDVDDATLGIGSRTAVCPLGSPEILTEEAQCCSCKCDGGNDARPCKDNPRDP